MDVYKFDIKNNTKQIIDRKSILILGEFEIFHKGHFKLFNKAKDIQNNELLGILIIDKKTNFQTLENRLDNLAKIGFDFVILCDFNFEFKSLEADQFLNYLKNNFNVNNFIIGSDFKFAKDRKNEASDIEKISNIKTYIVDLDLFNKVKISSSDIKQMHEFGEYNLIKDLVVNPLVFDINLKNNETIEWDNKVTKPHSGIYYMKLLIDDYWYHGIIHFSMFNTIEYHLVNLPKDFNLFDQKTKIEILDICRIITNSRNDNITNDDIQKAKDYFSY